jgi:hypothetical protein
MAGMETTAPHKKLTTYIIAKIKFPSAGYQNYTIEGTTTISVAASMKKEEVRNLAQQHGWKPKQIRSSSVPCLLWWYPEDRPEELSQIIYQRPRCNSCTMNQYKSHHRLASLSF